MKPPAFKPLNLKRDILVSTVSSLCFRIHLVPLQRGLDIRGLPYVINMTLPDKSEDYIHRIGRVGRADTMGLAISLVSAKPERVGAHSLPGVRLVTWTILAVINWGVFVISLPYTLLGLSLPGVRLVTWTTGVLFSTLLFVCSGPWRASSVAGQRAYWLSSIETCFDCKITW